jgi:hypothetical protein
MAAVNCLARSTASPTVLFIFQFPAMKGNLSIISSSIDVQFQNFSLIPRRGGLKVYLAAIGPSFFPIKI